MEHELVYSQTVLLLPKSDSFSFSVSVSSTVSWRVKIKLVNDTSKTSLTSQVSTDSNNIIIELNNWYSDSWVENEDPFIATSKDKTVEFLIKIRLSMSRLQTQKQLTATVWKKV